MQRRNFFKSLLGILGIATIAKTSEAAIHKIQTVIPQTSNAATISESKWIQLGDLVKYKDDWYWVTGFNSNGPHEPTTTINASSLTKEINDIRQTDIITFRDWEYDEELLGEKIKKVIDRDVVLTTNWHAVKSDYET